MSKTKHVSLRGITRFYAVQLVYCSEITNKAISDVICDFEKNNMEIYLTEDDFAAEIDAEFFKKILSSLEENLEKVDDLINNHLSKTWEINRLDLVEKSILRLGVTELLYLNDVPSNVVFNEYIEISKAFFEKRDVSFINGILNSIAKGIETSAKE